MPYCATLPGRITLDRIESSVRWYTTSQPVTLATEGDGYSGSGLFFIHSSFAGLSACPAGTHVLVTLGEYDALRELSVINQTLKDELAATRATISTKGDETKAEVATARDTIAGQVNYHGQTAKSQDAEFFGGAVVLFAVLIGWFIGFKWVGGN